MIVSAGIEKSNGRTRDSNVIVKRWREKQGEDWVRKEEVVRNFRPYVFVNPNNLVVKGKVTSGGLWIPEGYKKVPFAIAERTLKELLFGIEIHKGDSPPYQDAAGNTLWKVSFDSPSLIWLFKKRFSSHFEADVPYEDRYLVDCVDEMPEYKMRKLYIDLEALQFRMSEGESPYMCNNKSNPRDCQEINVIGVYDDFSNTYVQWCFHEVLEVKEELMEFDGKYVMVNYFDNEKDMLQSFVDYLEIIDPDILLAWGMGFYDLPTLYYRLESCGIGSNKLSPSSLGKHRYVDNPRYKGNQYRWTQQPIRGRLVVSLDRLFERVYRDSKSANLPSNKLGIVGEKLFNQGKAYERDENGEHVLDENGEPIPFKPDFYDKAYDEWLDDYLYYNFRDVELMVDIDTKYNLIEGQQALQNLAKCQFKSTFYGSSYARAYFMRKADFKQRSGFMGEEVDDSDLQGAIVMDPDELDTVGLHKNVVILDFAGLYPSMMVAYNTSWETKVRKGEEKDDDIKGDRCRFRREPMGILPASVIELDELRDHYKDLRDEAAKKSGKGSDEYRKWDDAQKTVKRLRATFYGLMAFQDYAWADMDIARTITYGGRTALMDIKKESEKLGYEVIYGHTDSIFVKLGDDLTVEECAEASEKLGIHLTDYVQKKLESTAVIVEPELIMDRFYLPRRNKYGGRIVWQPGSGNTPFDVAKLPVEDRMKIQGLEAKFTNTARIGREIQVECLKRIWDDCSSQELLDYIKGYIAEVHTRPVEDLFARARIGKWLTPTRYLEKSQHYGAGATNQNAKPDAADPEDACYVVLGGTQRGAAWHNIILSNDSYSKMDKGDSHYTTFVSDGPTWIPTGGYVSFHDYEQIKDYQLDYSTIIEKNIIDKLDNILRGMRLSRESLREKSKQLSLDDFV